MQRGDITKRGQLLFRLDTESEALGRDAALARSERAQAQAENLKKGRRPLEMDVIDQQLGQAQAALTGSTATLQRNQRLVEQSFVAPVRLDEFSAARDRDAARVKELQAQRSVANSAARPGGLARDRAFATRCGEAALLHAAGPTGAGGRGQ